MSCVLRAVGQLFDVTTFLKDSPIANATPFRKGEPKGPGNLPGGAHSASGFNVPLGDAESDSLSAQVRDATIFVQEYEAELRRLGSFPGVEEVCIDFAIPRLEGGAQHDLFPADFLWRVGALDIDLVVTHYTLAGERSDIRPN